MSTIRNLLKNEEWRIRTISYIIVVVVGIAFATFIWRFDGVLTWLSSLISLLFPFILAFIISFILTPIVTWIRTMLDKHVFTKKPHPMLSNGIGIFIAYVLLISAVAGFIAVLLPQLIQSIRSLTSFTVSYINQHGNEINDQINKIGEAIGNVDLANTLKTMLSDTATRVLTYSNILITNILYIGMSISSFVVQIFIALIGGVYLLIGKVTFVNQIKKIMCAFFPAKRVGQIIYWTRTSQRIFSGYINGKLLDSLIIGVLCYVLTLILHIDYALLISVVVGLTNILPFFGPFIGAVPCIIILLMVDPFQALRFAIMILCLQQVDGNVIGPRILGDSLGISSFWIMLAIVVGGGLFGFAGMLFGVPVFAFLYTIVRTIVQKKLTKKGLSLDSENYADIDSIIPGKDEV